MDENERLGWGGTAMDARPDSAGRSVGLVHDYLLVMRGAERTFAAIADCWPDAPIYTLLFDARRDRRGASTDRTSPRPTCSARACARAGSGGCCRSSRARSSSCPSRSTTCVVSSSSAFAHGVRPERGRRARLLLPHAVPLRLATSASRRWREMPAPAAPGHATACSSGSARGTATASHARRPLPRELGVHASERIARLLRPRRGGRPPAGRRRALHARRARGLLPGGQRGGARTSASSSRWRPPPRAGGASRWSASGPGPATPPGARTADTADFLGRVSDDELARLSAARQALIVPERRGVRHRGGRGPGRGPPGDRRRRRRRAGDRDPGHDRRARAGGRRGRDGRGAARRSTSPPTTRRSGPRNAQRFSAGDVLRTA